MRSGLGGGEGAVIRDVAMGKERQGAWIPTLKKFLQH